MPIEVFTIYIVLFLVAIVVVLVATPVAAKIAWRVGAVDYPSVRRINTKATPRMGGVAIMLALITAVIVLGVGSSFLGWPPVTAAPHLGSLNYGTVLFSVLAMFLVGVIDDIWQLSALPKLIGQVVAASIAVAGGLVVGNIVNPADESQLLSLGMLSPILTVFYLVAYSNIINLIDGVDGLASGLACIASATLFILAVWFGRGDAATLAITLCGATLAFLRYNFNPASIFLGDSGSLLLGYSLGVISLLNVTRIAGVTMLIVPVVIAGVPILDTFSAIIRRARTHVSIGRPDKGHIHHRLLREGFNQRQTVLMMYAWTALLCGGSLLMAQVGMWERVALFVLLVALTFGFAHKLRLFQPVLRRRFDPESGTVEVVPTDDKDADDFSQEEIREILGGETHEADQKVRRPSDEKRLRILAVGQHYWPEPFNFPDICEGLVARGHEVTMLTGLPNYPEGNIYEGYRHGENREQVHNGVRVLRSAIVPRGQDVIHRVVNYYSFSESASRKARTIEEDFDVVLSFQTSPVMMSKPALVYARNHDVPVLLYCIDIWPECLTAGGIRKDSVAFNYFKGVSKRIYEEADRLAVTSPMFASYFEEELGMSVDEPLYLPQYAEDIFGEEGERTDLEFDTSKLNLTFAGNIGAAQSVQTLVEAANILKGDTRFAFHVVGSGSELEECKILAGGYGLENITFYGRRPLSQMPSFYRASDAMLATFANSPVLGYTLPRKIQSYLAAGCPVIGTTVGEARRVIEEAGCGLCCDAEDAEALARLCAEFARKSAQEREAMGRRAREYYLAHYSRDDFFATLESELLTMKGTGHAD